jgi:hypothetical protein
METRAPFIPFDETDCVPWFPESLADAVADASELRQWAYVVLEEIVGGEALLVRCDWPMVDARGRLYWVEDPPPADPLEAGVSLRALRMQLYEANHLQRRPHIGDTFAAPIGVAGWGLPTPVIDLTDLFSGPLYDVSADAYEAARLAYQSSVSAMIRVEDEPEMQETLTKLSEERRARRAPRLELAPRDER